MILMRYLFLLAALTLNSWAMVRLDVKDRALFTAIEENNLDAVKKALDDGAHIEAYEPTYSKTPLMLAAEKGNLEMVRYLLSKKANVKAVSADNINALHWAATSDVKPELIELLIKSGIPVNAVDDSGDTALHGVISVPVARVLLEHGLDINSQNKLGFTPLSAVIAYINSDNALARSELVKFFLAEGADTTIKTKDGRSVFDLANRIGDAKIKSQFIALLEKFNKNRDPLFAAVLSGNKNEVKKLVQEIPINIKDKKGNTPLHLAVRSGNNDMVKFLLSIKADPSIKNRSGETAVNLAVGTDILPTFMQLGVVSKTQK